MTRQSISLTAANDAWLKYQVETEEYSSKSDLVNDLIRQARRQEQQEIALVRAKLIAAETSGFTQKTVAEIKREALQGLGVHDDL
jgi:antitoxin ParD1/3/4